MARVIKITPLKIAFGNMVKTRRIFLKYTQEQLAERADLNLSFVRQIERGHRDVGRKIKEKVSAKTEVEKAKLGITSGDDDNATVYKLTKEQKEYLGKLYNKYGKELIDKIMKFRNEVVAPYQVIKRNVQKSSKLTDAEVFGMSKEEFFRYRESGRRKIERRKNYDKNFEEQHKELTRQRIS